MASLQHWDAGLTPSRQDPALPQLWHRLQLQLMAQKFHMPWSGQRRKEKKRVRVDKAGPRLPKTSLERLRHRGKA